MSDLSSDNNKRIAKNTSFLYVRMIILLLVSLYTSRVVLQTLGIVDYGIYNVVGGVVTMFAFLNSAMASATQRFLNFSLGKKNKEELNNIFCTSIIIHFFIAVCVIILSETVGLWFMHNKMVIPADRFDAALWIFQCSMLAMVINIISVPYNAVIIAHEKMGAFAYISLLEALLKLLIVYLLMISSLDKLKLYGFLLLIVSVTIRMIYSNYSKRHFDETKFTLSIDKPKIIEMGLFACWNLIGNLALMGVTQGLNMVLNVFFGPIVNAARGIAVQVQGVVQQFATNLQMAINPQITKSYAHGDMDYLCSLVCNSSKYSFFLVYFLSLPIILMADQILEYWLVTPPVYSTIFLRLILMCILIDCMSNSLGTTISSSGKIRIYQLINGLTMLSILPISIFLLNVCKNPALVFIVQFIITVCTHFLKLFFASKYSNLTFAIFFRKVYVRIIVVTASSVIIPLIVHNTVNQNFLTFILTGIICMLSVLISVFAFGMRKAERATIYMKIRVLKSKLQHFV